MINEKEESGPLAAVGAVVIHEGRVLLIKRRNPPQKGFWAIPGGRILSGETIQAAAEREVREETGLKVRAGEPVHVFDLIERSETGELLFHYIIVDLAVEYQGGRLSAGDDAEEARWFSPQDMDDAEPVSPPTRNLLKKMGFIY